MADDSLFGDSLDPAELVREFLPLNRRRTRGNPPLRVAEFERWMELRGLLEQILGFVPPDPAAAVAPLRSLRVPTHLKVSCLHGSDCDLAQAKNLSEGGLFLATRRPLAPGTPVHLEIQSDAGSVEVEGTVTWVREAQNPGGEAGMGIRFENVSPETGEQIAGLVEQVLEAL
jgi:uncharacterized protein (TIGR02266 family)